MKKQIQIEIDVCDICQEEKVKTKCRFCGKEICYKCSQEYYPPLGDMYLMLCVSCFENGKPFREKLTIMDNEIDDIFDDWRIFCKRSY